MALVFLRILLAYDDSSGSHIALEYACALTGAGAKLTIAHAVNEKSIVASATTATGFAAIDPTPLIASLNDQGATVLRSAVDACATRGVDAESIFLHDSAATGIVALARARQVDLIVIGTHGRHGVPRALLGSVAEDILRSSEVPVLAVTGHAKSPGRDRIFPRALVALDESDPSRAALSIAARLATDLATHLTLCNVVNSRNFLEKAAQYGYDASPLETNMHAAALKLLERAAHASDVAASANDLVVVEGEPAVAIERTALQHNCDVIIIGSHGRHGLERLFLGSVAETVLRTSSLPVLVTPAGKHVPRDQRG